jgi:hypothetical protein
MRVGGQSHAPAALPPGKINGTNCTRGSVGPTVGIDGVRKISPAPGLEYLELPATSKSLYRLS